MMALLKLWTFACRRRGCGVAKTITALRKTWNYVAVNKYCALSGILQW
jgi:hypothetical protein